ncbi:MAG: hypothetical protein ACHQK8_05950 [Bacteroidia bacterium]
MRKLLAVFFIFFSLQIWGQYRTGLILPKYFMESTRRDSFCCVLFPDSNCNLYDKPGGKKLGRICRVGDPNWDEHHYEKLYFKLKKTKPELLGLDIFREIGFETYCFGFDDIRNGYVRVFTPLRNFWLSIAEIKKMEYTITGWNEFIIKSAGKVNGFFPNSAGVSLHRKPDADSKVILNMKGVEFVITPTGTCKGRWCKVRVKQYKKNPCVADRTDEPNLIRSFEGWILLTDPTGNPLIWFYTHGC